MKQITVFKTTADEVETLFKQHYGIKYEIVAGELCNSSSYLFYAIDNKPLDDYDLKEVEKIKSGKHPEGCTRTLMNLLCVDGHIEAGQYLINAGW